MIANLLHMGVLLTLAKPSLQISNRNFSNYIGAVVQYHPVTDGDDGQMIAEANANNYRTIIKTAAEYKADIIVFPEFGVTSLPKDGNGDKRFNATGYRAYYRDTASYIPSPNETVVLCDTDTKYAMSLQSISCSAKEYKMYVVVNHHEKVDCPTAHCAPDNFLLYNTNVVFDREGRVIARYRKYNLFNEPGTNVTAEPETSTFATDFGVTFGQFICFDILQEKPATYFARNPNVTDLVYSTHWFDETPFMQALQVQASWAYGADVNFLAAGYSESLTASGGSGIYAGKGGPIVFYNPRVTSNALLVAEIPKLDRRYRKDDGRTGNSFIHVFKQAEVPTVSGIPQRLTESPVYKDDLRPYTSVMLDPTQGSHITTLCDRGLCCDFHVETSYDKDLAAKPDVKQYRYRLLVFNGVRSFGNVSTSGLEVCALVSCAGNEIQDCSRLYAADSKLAYPTTFDSLIITRRADLEQRSFYAPTTLARNLEPMGNGDFAYLASGRRNSSLLLMYLVRPTSDIMTFGIYARRFDRDGQDATKPTSGNSSLVPSAIAVGLMLLSIFGLRNNLNL